jgi:uncharacterized membrane protein YfcA
MPCPYLSADAKVTMHIWDFTLIIWAGSVAAGLLGALTGLGGGVVIVPMLALGFGVDIHYAIGASLVSVIATSSGAAVAYVREGFSNIRVGMLLEIATTLGATGGALLAAIVAARWIAAIFGAVLILSVYSSVKGPAPDKDGAPPDRLATRLRLDGHYPARDGRRAYHVRNVPIGFGLMGVAGVLSGLLGIGSGALKVLAMDQAMRLPFKVSTTTSNFMIGVTAAASAGIYLNRGYIDPGLAMPTMLGVLVGSLTGARLLARMRTPVLRWVFGALIFALGIEMVVNAMSGRL